jgi:Histidine kinase-, DNA gyrase B-, and HSP90-like ATPase
VDSRLTPNVSATAGETSEISIRPGVGILSVLRHLNYRPWFAMAEFCDNSLQSYVINRSRLESEHGSEFRLVIDVEIDRSDEFRIRIRDNAAGIDKNDYPRAFRAAELPPDRSGLAEFGMGMKSAACWFAPKWKVRTTALGETVERTVSFDIAKIVRDELDSLSVHEEPALEGDHFTEITLINPYDRLQSKTSSKTKDHLASIYRVFLRENVMEIGFIRDGIREKLSYDHPKILVAPYFKSPNEPARRWYREFAFDFGLGLRASGFAALRETASTSTAGFALFRRNRLIEGSLDEPYRPEMVFGSGNTYRKQRLIGEINLDGFEVSHTKDGFKWDEHEQSFLELLRDELERPEMPLLSQAEGFRARTMPRGIRDEAEKATENVAEALKRDAAPVLLDQSEATPSPETLPITIRSDEHVVSRVIELMHRNTPWSIHVELSLDPAIDDWLTISDDPRSTPRTIAVRLALAHPFMRRFCKPESQEIEALLRIAAAFGLAEITARDSGVPQYGTIRRNVNQLLREALSKP